MPGSKITVPLILCVLFPYTRAAKLSGRRGASDETVSKKNGLRSGRGSVVRGVSV